MLGTRRERVNCGDHSKLQRVVAKFSYQGEIWQNMGKCEDIYFGKKNRTAECLREMNLMRLLFKDIWDSSFTNASAVKNQKENGMLGLLQDEWSGKVRNSFCNCTEW